MANYIVCVSDARHANYDIEAKILDTIGAELRICHCETPEEIAAECGEADAILLDLAPMTRKAIAGLSRCRIISRYGVGYDNVDVETCTEKGIQVTNVPDYCADDVSEHALALMMACLRDVSRRDRLIRQGQWNLRRDSFRLKGKTLGILGFGRIARSLVGKCSGFGFAHILAYDPYVSREDCRAFGVEKVELDEVMCQADFLSLHMVVLFK